jgi:hypothetical protein
MQQNVEKLPLEAEEPGSNPAASISVPFMLCDL